jgi:hypothetical protein
MADDSDDDSGPRRGALIVLVVLVVLVAGTMFIMHRINEASTIQDCAEPIAHRSRRRRGRVGRRHGRTMLVAKISPKPQKIVPTHVASARHRFCLACPDDSNDRRCSIALSWLSIPATLASMPEAGPAVVGARPS